LDPPSQARGGGEDASAFTETDVDNDGDDFIADVTLVSSPG
jgi:hypothetical protein